MWDLKTLSYLIIQECEKYNFANVVKLRADYNIAVVNALCLLNNITLPQPLIEVDDNNLFITWLRQSKKRALWFSTDENSITLLNDAKCSEIISPTDKDILEKIKEFLE